MSKRSKLFSLKLDFSKIPQRLHFDFSQPEIKQEDQSLGKEPKLENQSDKWLLCLDFDGTMVKGSISSTIAWTPSKECVDKFLADETKSLKEKEQFIVLSDSESHIDKFLADETKGWKNKEQLVKLLTTALDLGCHIAIVSFCSHPGAIKYALTQLGLEEAKLKEIRVVSYCPNEENSILAAKLHNSIKFFW
ncbi:hypothetical protein [Candidatus Tisiphia endosymbiont of Hybos culiciformis]|uniref:hypothetical protein n=1 Tax=Candidatus Tisiphia endosymbiont of Hybos culiciformis TaxID=3139331 RepID=UPI003CCAC8BA